MTIVYVSDDNYAHILGISLLSLYSNNKEEPSVSVYIIDDGISQKNKDKLTVTAKRFGREIRFFKANLSTTINNMGKWPKNIFYRFSFLSILGDELKDNRVLYLDCDTVVADNILELWNTDMDGKACAAVYECIGKKHKENCRLSDDLPYYNSGVLLMDVHKWKELDVEKRVQKIIALNTETKMEYPDEGIINYLLKGNVKTLKPCSNLTTIKCVFSYKELKMYRKSKFMYSEEDYFKAKTRPCIIHYTDNFLVRRPWQSGTRYEHPMAKYFLQYKDDSEWKDWPTLPERIGVAKKIVRKLFSFNGMLCTILAGFIYSYIKPLKYDKLTVSEE